MARMEFDKLVGRGDCIVEFILLEIGVGYIKLRLFGVFTERVASLECFEVLNSGNIFIYRQLALGFAV